jgi:hypothetical protein
LAIRLESFVESDSALGNIPVERQCEKDLRRNSLMDKFWNVIETDGPNIIAGKGAEFFNQFSSSFAYGRENEFGAAVVAHPQSILSNT